MSSRAVSPPESAYVGFRASSPLKEHPSEHAAHRLRGLGGVVLHQPFQCGLAVNDLIAVVLRIVAPLHPLPHLTSPASGHLSDQAPEKRRLARAVPPDDGDFLASPDVEIQVPQRG